VENALLTLPTSCSSPQPSFLIRELSGWQDPNAKSERTSLMHDADNNPVNFTGCEDLAFGPAITTTPESARADTPTGFTAEVRPPLAGLEEPGLLASAELKNTTVTLPAGLVINPGQAAGLQACSRAEAALESLPGGEENDGPAACPAASKVGTVLIKSPLIEAAEEKQLEGDVYVLPSNPPDIKLLVAASADGVNLKIEGSAHLNEQTGQVSTSFLNTPQMPFSLFKLSFAGGVKAALDTPTRCGTFSSTADFTPWSSPLEADFIANPSFAIGEGSGGSACPSGALPFAPSLTAGTASAEGGAFTSFSTLLARGDGQQRVQQLQFKSPAGLSAMIAGVAQCDEANANAGTCPAASHIGHAIVQSGPGANPLTLPQPGAPELPIYLTGPYKGAPFGLSIVTPVIAGPFNLGTIITRASIAVDPVTAQITVTTDPLPQIVKGVPTDLRSIQAVIDRPGFMFNPTNCTAEQFSGSASGAEGASAPVSSPFTAGACRALQFHPKFSASTAGKASKAGGASLEVKVAAKGGPNGGEANIHSVKVALPLQLPSRLTTLQKACLAKVFDANPASCPKESNVGTATARTPILANPLAGPAYLVSHGNAGFPDLEIVLQGEGIKLVLDGHTDIKKGITTSTFETVPDAPISSFELKLPTGPFSVLATNLPAKAKYSLCSQKLSMPTTITAQNGLVLNQSTKIAIGGCAKAKTLTRAQKLAKAMKACHKKTQKGKRAGCEAQARRRFGRVAGNKAGRRKG
jgi:hypothetical protein